MIAAAAAVAYVWDLDVQGWANPYYAAVVQAGTQSWSSFFFGSLEVGNAVASDKPPFAFWAMALSARAFGFSSWSVLLPQALETVAAVLLLHRAVRGVAGRTAGVVAAAVLAATPVVLVLARYDNPDTMMTLLVVAAAYSCLRATRSPRRTWMAATGLLLGLAFLTKWAVALVPAPAFAAALWAASGGSVRQRLQRVVVFGSAVVVTAMSWVAVVMLVPAQQRPYADGSQGSVLSLIVGRDGFSRLGGTLGAGTELASGSPSPWRLFVPPFATQVGWLLPLAVGLLALVAVVAWRDRSARLGGNSSAAPGWRAAWLLFGGWLLISGAVLSVMSGPMHPYYSVLLAPAVGAVIALGVADLRRRGRLRLALPLVAATLAYEAAVVAHAGLGNRAVLVGGLAVVAATAAPAALARHRRARRALPALVVAPVLAVPLAFGLTTDSHPVTGYDPVAGPGRPLTEAAYPHTLVRFLRAHREGSLWLAAVPRATAASLLQLQSHSPVLPLGGFTGHASGPTVAQVRAWVESDRLRYVVIPRDYTGYPMDTPRALAGWPVASVLQWAQRTGCPEQTGDRSFVVLDLDRNDLGRAPLGPGSACARTAGDGPGG